MNTALARRLALGDRVTWAGKNDYQPSGPGTVIRITAHQVEVLWEGETARRYRRTQLHNFRHTKLICGLHGEWVQRCYSEGWSYIDCGNRKADRGVARNKKFPPIRGGSN